MLRSEVLKLLIPRGLSPLLRLELGNILTLIPNPPLTSPLKKNWNTIKGHASENLSWRICDEVLPFMKENVLFFPIINASVPAKPLLIPNVLEDLGIAQQREDGTDTELQCNTT